MKLHEKREPNDPNEGYVREEFAVEWRWPDGGRSYSLACSRRGDAEAILADRPAMFTGRVVRRVITTTAWEVPPADVAPGAPQARSIPDGRDA